MNKIFNWTVGSFFRSIGRMIAYLLFGLLIGYLLKNANIDFTNLLFMSVNASEITEWTTSQTRLTLDNMGSSSFTDFYSTPHTFSDLSLPVKRVQFRVRASSGLSTENTYTFTFGYQPNPDSISWGSVGMLKNGDSNYTEDNFTCGNVYVNNYGYYLTDCTLSPRYNYSSSDYLWITIALAGSGGYQDSIRPYMFGYDERLGTNAVITNQTNNIINNQNNNTSSIINNNNQNTQSIINNQNNNTQAQIDAQMVCTNIDKTIANNRGYLSSNGSFSVGTGTIYVTDFISISKSSTIKVLLSTSDGYRTCFYDDTKTNISCIGANTMTQNTFLTIPNNAKYVRFTINSNTNRPQFELCKNGNQALTDTLNDDDTSSSTNELGSFFENFTTNTHGLTGVITAPLNAINSLTSATCSPLVLPLPYIDEDLTLPCMRALYDEHFGNFMTLYDVITLGIISYWVMIRIFNLVKDFKNPEHDEIEVMDL